MKKLLLALLVMGCAESTPLIKAPQQANESCPTGQCPLKRSEPAFELKSFKPVSTLTKPIKGEESPLLTMPDGTEGYEVNGVFVPTDSWTWQKYRYGECRCSKCCPLGPHQAKRRV